MGKYPLLSILLIFSISSIMAQNHLPKNELKVGYIHSRPIGLSPAFMKKLNDKTGLNGVSLQYLTLTTNSKKKNGVYVGLQLDYSTGNATESHHIDYHSERKAVVEDESNSIRITVVDPDNPDPDPSEFVLPPGFTATSPEDLASNPDLEYCLSDIELDIKKRVHALSLMLPVALKADFLTLKFAPGVKVIYTDLEGDVTMKQTQYIAGTNEIHEETKISLIEALGYPTRLPTVPKIGFVMDFQAGININQLVSSINKKPNKCPINVEVTAGLSYSNVSWNLIDIEKSDMKALENLGATERKIAGIASEMVNPSREYFSANVGASLIYIIPNSKKKNRNKANSSCPKF